MIPRHIRIPSIQHFHNPESNLFTFLNDSANSSLFNLIDTKSSMKILHTNCSLPQKKPNDCSYVQFEALLNVADRTVCKCENPKITTANKCITNCTVPQVSTPPVQTRSSGVTIFAITPTYSRLTQKVDLTSLCHTIQHVPDFIWIVIEDSRKKSKLVKNLLERCKVRG